MTLGLENRDHNLDYQRDLDLYPHHRRLKKGLHKLPDHKMRLKHNQLQK